MGILVAVGVEEAVEVIVGVIEAVAEGIFVLVGAITDAVGWDKVASANTVGWAGDLSKNVVHPTRNRI